MVLVLCLNAAVDKTAAVPQVRPHRRHRLGTTLALPGGKGINVARALLRLGDHPTILGFTAGHSGRFIEEGVQREGLPAAWVRLARGESRTCLSILNGRDEPTEFNESGPRVRPADTARLEAAFRRLLPRCALVVVSGSLPVGCPASVYARLIAVAKAAGKKVLLDTSEEALARALAAGPDVAKLNHEEAASLGLPASGGRSLRPALRGLLRRGASEAIITMGAGGAAGLIGGRFFKAVPPKVKAVTPIGCGDTFLAGVAHSMLRGRGPEETLAFATAVATASALVLGAGVFRPRDVPGVLRRTKILEAA